MKSIFLIILTGAIFFGCISKQYFKPQNKSSFKLDIINTPTYIKSINAQGATLEDNRYLNKNGISKDRLKNGFYYLNSNSNTIISANKNGALYINDRLVKFKITVVSASLKDNILALVFSDNSIGIYDIDTDNFKMKDYLEPSYLNDTRVAAPLFIDNSILFPALDGRVIIYDINNFKKLNILNIDAINEVNNIIMLKQFDNNIVIATQNVIVSISKGNTIKKEFFIQSMITDDSYIFIATLDGKIIKMDKELNIINQKKYEFAKFQAISISNTHIIAIESQGYVIKLSLDFQDEQIDSIPFEDDEKTFSVKNKIYFEDKLLRF